MTTYEVVRNFLLASDSGKRINAETWLAEHRDFDAGEGLAGCVHRVLFGPKSSGMFHYDKHVSEMDLYIPSRVAADGSLVILEVNANGKGYGFITRWRQQGIERASGAQCLGNVGNWRDGDIDTAARHAERGLLLPEE